MKQERDAFVLVLIDGDGMIFDDHLIQKGEVGGKEAAGQLWTAVRDYVHQKMTGLSSDYKIVTRIYANLKGLGDVCYRSGIIESPGILEDFMHGFTGGKQLFDFIDVGSGKDRADDKICGDLLVPFGDFHAQLKANRVQKCSNFTYIIVIVDILYLDALTITVMPGSWRMWQISRWLTKLPSSKEYRLKGSLLR